MNMLKLNETPLRTARNFKINNIKLENVEIPKKIEKFDNVNIINDNNNVSIKNIKNDVNIKYGVGEILINQINEKSNVNLEINIMGKNNENIILNFELDSKNKNLIDNINIVAKENSISNVIIKYTSKDDEVFHNGICNVIAEKNSKINITIVNLINDVSNNFYTINNIIKEDASVNYRIIDFGGKNSISNYYSNISDRASNNVDTIYIGDKEKVLDINYIAELYGKASKINMNVEGALNDYAKKNFKGTIDFKSGCAKSIGYETEYCILLSDNVRAKSLPMLLCGEEDVEGEHSAAAGKVDAKQLFYIMSRGFSYNDALKLIIRARFNKVIKKLDEDLKNIIIEEIDRRLK